MWFLQYRDPQGAKRRQRIGTVAEFPTKAAAERGSAGVRERINDPYASSVAPKTMLDVVERYRAEEMPKAYATARGYHNILENYILPKWGARPVQGIKAHELRIWLRELTLVTDGRTQMSDKGKKHVRGLLGSLFRFAMLWEWYEAGENPLRLFQLQRSKRPVKRPRVRTPDEFVVLLRQLEEPYRSMVMLCGCLGLRCSEMIGLQWGDIDWRLKTLTVSRGVVNGYEGDAKTLQSTRPIPLSEELVEMLLGMQERALTSKDTHWLFPSVRSNGKPLNAYKIQHVHLKPAAALAGLGVIGWHTLRHSYRAWLDRAGAPVGVQRDLMRHSDIRTTMNVYGDSFLDNLRDVQGGVAKMILQ